MTDQAILDLHRAQTPHSHAVDIIWTHSQIVLDIAHELIGRNHLQLDPEIIRAGSLLHDIGYYALLDHTGYVPSGVSIKHGVIGAGILRAAGLPEAVCRIAERHTGVGLSRQFIIVNNFPLPHRDLMPETPEEWLITYADKFHSKSIGVNKPHDVLGRFNSVETYTKYIGQFGESNSQHFSQLVERYGQPNLPALAAKYDQTVS